MSKRNDISLGVILIVIGVIVFLLNVNLLPNNVLKLGLGVAFLIAYYYKRQTGYLIAGLILTLLGAISLIEEYVIRDADVTGLFFMWGLGIAFLVMYFSKNIKAFVYPGCILPAIGTYSFVEELFKGDTGWLFFLLLGLAFYAIYLIEHRSTGSNWPLIPGTVLVVLSGVLLLTSKEIITTSFWKVISYIWPIILILVGAKIVYNNSRVKE